MSKEIHSDPSAGPGDRIPPAQAVKLADLVSYANEAIVSRTIAEGPGGTITVFAFDAGQGLSEHSAPFDALVLVLDGRAELIIGGKSVPTSAGHMTLMPAGVPHAVKAPQRFKMLLVMLKSQTR
ncbi:MAG: cupin domain-containing protein [Phycisphaerae bacterium]|jgi:quercetin dioxygenase-like cupin family protein